MDYVMKKMGFPLGPLALIDEMGIDVCASLLRDDLANFFRNRGFPVSDMLDRMLQKEFKGRSNGNGFYEYEEENGHYTKKGLHPEMKQFFHSDNARAFSSISIQHRLLLMMVNESAHCLQEGFSASIRAASGLSGIVWWLYSHLTVGGRLIKIDSIRPFVLSPNKVPLS